MKEKEYEKKVVENIIKQKIDKKVKILILETMIAVYEEGFDCEVQDVVKVILKKIADEM